MKSECFRGLTRNVVWFYLSMLILSFAIFFFRFPNAYYYPNFYAEDGKNFAMNIINNGFLDSIFTRFNGYYIFGLYILTGIGVFISRFFDSGFILLPKILAIVSYSFLAFVVTLPVLLFSDKIKKYILVFLVLFSSFVPLMDSDYAVIGTIGNLKFIFAYIAFLLILYRLFLAEWRKMVLAIDIFIALCAYTNPAVYFMIIPIYFKYTQFLFKERFNFNKIKSLYKNISFLSSIGLGFVLLVQAVVIYFNGLPVIKDYMDDPFDYSRIAEIFIARSYLFPFVYPFYNKLNDVFSVVFIISTCYLILSCTERKNRIVYLLGFYSIFIATFVFVITRTGISSFFKDYDFPGGPSQFFYTQNLIVYFLAFFFFNEVIKSLSGKSLILLYPMMSILVVILFISAPFSGSFGKNNFMQKLGSFSADASMSCKSSDLDPVEVQIYPDKAWSINVSRNLICNRSFFDPKPDYVDFGLKPANGKFLESGIQKGTIATQSFISDYNGLSGISVYLSTFYKKIETPYFFSLVEEGHDAPIRNVRLDVRKISDNRYFDIYFDPISDSDGKKYIFSLVTDSDFIKTPLTFQMSQPGSYNEGELSINGIKMREDMVFRLLYRKVGGVFHDNMQ